MQTETSISNYFHSCIDIIVGKFLVQNVTNYGGNFRIFESSTNSPVYSDILKINAKEVFHLQQSATSFLEFHNLYLNVIKMFSTGIYVKRIIVNLRST